MRASQGPRYESSLLRSCACVDRAGTRNPSATPPQAIVRQLKIAHWLASIAAAKEPTIVAEPKSTSPNVTPKGTGLPLKRFPQKRSSFTATNVSTTLTRSATTFRVMGSSRRSKIDTWPPSTLRYQNSQSRDDYNASNNDRSPCYRKIGRRQYDCCGISGVEDSGACAT